jgi:hypothetical protein
VVVGRLVETLRAKFLNIQKALRNKVRLRGATSLESGGATIVAHSTLPRVRRAAGMEGRYGS